jgi:hypothetical protein
MQEHDTTAVESEGSPEITNEQAKLRSWIKVGAIAAASALAGGLAAAWYYRKTLDSLREADPGNATPDFGIQEETADNDT